MFTVVSCFNAHSQQNESLYLQGLNAAKSGNLDFAFINFHAFLNSHSGSAKVEPVTFTIGEYYFLTKNYRDAFSIFNKFINKYPDSKARPFAFAYLMKIGEIYAKEEFVENIKKEIVTFKQVGLLFSNFKEYVYRSLSFKEYKLVYFIDKAKFYINGELFSEIPY